MVFIGGERQRGNFGIPLANMKKTMCAITNRAHCLNC